MAEQQKLSLKEEKKLNSVEEYKFEPIKGYPMLHWKGKRPFTSGVTTFEWTKKLRDLSINFKS